MKSFSHNQNVGEDSGGSKELFIGFGRTPVALPIAI